MKSLLIATLLLGLSVPLGAQDDSLQPKLNIPKWLQDFSNMPRAKREAFAEAFTEAKRTYQAQQWSACIIKLNECDEIYAANPNIQILRVACYQEMEMFKEALEIVLKQLKDNPKDVISQYNLSSIYMGLKDYQKCVDVTEPLLRNISMEDDKKFRDLLNFRLFICKLALDDEKGAIKVVEYCSILDDSPLYYMVQSAVSLYKKDRLKASENLKTAQRIYGRTMSMPAYERCLQKSGFVTDWDIAL